VREVGHVTPGKQRATAVDRHVSCQSVEMRHIMLAYTRPPTLWEYCTR